MCGGRWINMNEKNAKSQLKRWIIGFSNKYSVELGNYKEDIIIIFATILFEKARSLEYEIIFERVEELESWKFIASHYYKDGSNTQRNIEIDIKIKREIFDFAYSYVEQNYIDVDNILAWLYQYFNLNSNFQSEYKDTQFFTEQYMVDYLVDEALEHYVKEELLFKKIIDPACGGGNFIVRIVERLHDKLRVSDEKFIDVLENNIYCYDIDENLTFICYMNILIKLRELKVQFELSMPPKLNIFYDTNNKMGSLLKSKKNHQIFNVATEVPINYIDVFKAKFDIVITNPPFKGRRDLDEEVREYIKLYYPECKGDLCYAFIVATLDLLNYEGVCALVTQNGWMYLDSYDVLRRKLMLTTKVESIVDLGSGAFVDLSGEKTNVALLVFENKDTTDKIRIYNLKDVSYEEKVKFVNARTLQENKYELDIDRIKENDSWRLDYLNIGKLKEVFKIYPPYSEYGKPMQGTSTGDSKKYVAYHWEETGEEWKLVSKGGGYCKWCGLNWFKVHWGKNGEIIKQSPKAVIRNAQYFKDTELVYSDTGTSGLSVRLLLENQIFIASGPGIIVKKGDKYAHLGFLNSRVASYFIRTLTPKLTIAARYIGQLPVTERILTSERISELAKSSIESKTAFNRKRAINVEFQHDDYFVNDSLYQYAIEDFLDDLRQELNWLKNEDEINNIIENEYGFDDNELKIIYNTVGFPPYKWMENITISHQEIDNEICQLLDNNCMIKSTKLYKNTLGVEGILEYFAVKYRCSPKRLIEYIENHSDEYTKTLNKYYKNLLHKIKLMSIGYLSNCEVDMEYVRRCVSKDRFYFNVDIDFERWETSEVYQWHYEAFKKKPLKKMEDQSRL